MPAKRASSHQLLHVIVRTASAKAAYEARTVQVRKGAYEPTAPKHHWSGWYAAYVIARERGRTSDEAAKDATRHIEGALAART